MVEYRVRISPSVPSVPFSSMVEKWETLNQQYGLVDMFDEPIVNATAMSVDK
jgi:hypothetical protein